MNEEYPIHIEISMCIVHYEDDLFIHWMHCAVSQSVIVGGPKKREQRSEAKIEKHESANVPYYHRITLCKTRPRYMVII